MLAGSLEIIRPSNDVSPTCEHSNISVHFRAMQHKGDGVVLAGEFVLIALQTWQDCHVPRKNSSTLGLLSLSRDMEGIK